MTDDRPERAAPLPLDDAAGVGVEIRSLHVYPIKACGGIDVASARVTSRGLEGDRRWMIVDERGLMISQRGAPQLARLRPRVDGEDLALAFDGATARIPLALAAGARREVTVWKSTVTAIEHAASRAWISDVVGAPASLVYMPDDVERRATPRRGGRPGIVSFADAFAILVASEASLADLNARMAAPIAMARFRPNVVVTGGAPYAEDDWHTLRAGDVELLSSGPCDRCVVTTLDSDTGAAAGKEPLRTLATFRRWDGNVWFGVHVVPLAEGGRLREGDRIRVHERVAPR